MKGILPNYVFILFNKRATHLLDKNNNYI